MNRILVAGSSGFIGSHLVSYLRERKYDVVTLVRRKEQVKDATSIYWDPYQGEIDRHMLEGFDAVVNLAGANIASGRWTEKRKRELRTSRVIPTRFLCEVLKELAHPPKMILNASAIGYYGDTEGNIVTEASHQGRGFLPDLCREWESATHYAVQEEIRVVNLRIGVVLSRDGGMLGRILPLFKLGLGGVIGSGKQYMSWIALDDLLQIMELCIEKRSLRGPVNAVAPDPVTNREFTYALGEVLHRPTAIPLPAFMARLLFGEMADELLLHSSRVIPEKVLKSGYRFIFSDIRSFFIKGL